jgi:hypothetical protein
MKTAFLFLFSGVVLILLLLVLADTTFSTTSIDIRYTDTYYLISYSRLLLLVVLFLGCLSSIGGAIGSRFKKRIFLFLFLLFGLSSFLFVQYLVSELELYDSGNFLTTEPGSWPEESQSTNMMTTVYESYDEMLLVLLATLVVGAVIYYFYRKHKVRQLT